jgi:3-hydroxyacyl-CoA dehydrogenase
MSQVKLIRRIAVVGTGVIGASWTAFYLSRGFDVVATDPAPNAESALRKYVDEARVSLTRFGARRARRSVRRSASSRLSAMTSAAAMT